MNSNKNFEINKLKFDSSTGLIPAIVQDLKSKKILMQAYMNLESLQITLDSKKVTFFSRSRSSIWTKGESSGNFLNLVSIKTDCDSDTLLIQVHPEGPTCHLGTESCFENKNTIYENPDVFKKEHLINSDTLQNIKSESIEELNFLKDLESIIENRFYESDKMNLNTKSSDKNQLKNQEDKKSYVHSLIESGLDKIIQKVGEEAIETVIAAKNQDSKEFIYEASDLVFHLLVLLKAKNLGLKEITNELKSRHKV